MELPCITILTPTYDRKKFLPLMMLNVFLQSYPKDKIEWLICDSYSYEGKKADKLLVDDELKLMRKKLSPTVVNYHYLEKQMSIGEKRNWLVKNSKYKLMINMDSDDIYLGNYCRNIVAALQLPKVEIAGSPEMAFIYPNHNYQFSMIRCEHYRQIHEGAMGFTKKHWKRMGGFNKEGTGEGAGLFDGCSDKYFKKLPINDLMICVCHSDNTCDKDIFLEHKIEIENFDPPQLKLLKEHIFVS
tara:strand:+ start:21 stop:749 length:729 start_codon:yes stop_codon:yes gene_type:complete